MSFLGRGAFRATAALRSKEAARTARKEDAAALRRGLKRDPELFVRRRPVSRFLEENISRRRTVWGGGSMYLFWRARVEGVGNNWWGSDGDGACWRIE